MSGVLRKSVEEEIEDIVFVIQAEDGIRDA